MKEINVSVNYEYVDPFDDKFNYLLRVEHLGRYFFAADLLKGSKCVLDVACADGYGSAILSKYVDMVYGIEKNPGYLKIANNKYLRDNITYLEKNLDSENIDGKFDGIVCFETLEHLKYPDKVLKNLYNILEESGSLILSIPNSAYEKDENGNFNDSFHLHVFEYDEIVDLIKKIGFSIVGVYGQSFTNKIVNGYASDYSYTNVADDARTIGYPNNEDLDKTYSYIFVLRK